MKKRILSIIILAISLLSIFTLSACGKEEEKCSECDATLVEYECDNEHKKNLCTNKDCILAVGENEPVCLEKDCGEKLVKKMKFKLDFSALGESAMILCKGMLGIFIVTGVIITFILALNTIVEKIRQSKENKE